LIEHVFYNAWTRDSLGDATSRSDVLIERRTAMADPTSIHPIVAAASDIRSLLKGVAGVNPTFMTTDEKATALGELVRAEGQLAELRLRVLADSRDLADATGAKDAAGWLAHQTRTRFTDARADLALATALDRERPVLTAGMRDGQVTAAQAHVIRRAIDALPARVGAEAVALAEAKLVAYAEEFGPKELGRLGRRILDVVAPEIAEQAEADRLADLEAHAADKTRMTMRRQGDGTTRISASVSDAAATRFATYLEAFANPRLNPSRDDSTRHPRMPPTRSLGCPTRSASARRSPSSSKPSTRSGSRSMAATPPQSSSPSRSPPSVPSSAPATCSVAASCLVTTSPATGSPQRKRDGSRAPRRSSPRSSTASRSRSTSAAPSGFSPPPSARHS
jgi:hypothetical protein